MDLAVTVTGEQTKKINDNLSVLDDAIAALRAAGMMGKAEKAEAVMVGVRNALGTLAGDVDKLTLDLAHIKKHGFGG